MVTNNQQNMKWQVIGLFIRIHDYYKVNNVL